MGVAVHNPEDCLKLPNSVKHPRNPRHNPNLNPNRTNRRKRTPNASPPSRHSVAPSKAPAKNLVMGQVKILKRGEDLKESKPDKPVESVDSENDDGKVVLPFFHAGSAFITSPPPSSVPLPAFFTKKIGIALKDDVATNALRRILRLDLVI
ncbi:Detected protein of unknown function [Hibiscus syriacus]|uniref:Uncharacterized protein n=1 Tax=Hibiscus syriacus TaxID=106335 RepID=A0A6A3C0E5_HIBSY|nr:Detected protein of unknown function [Hibiscus syriacus]